MQMIWPDNQGKKAVRPWQIFRQALGVWRARLWKFLQIGLVCFAPVLVLGLLSANLFPGGKALAHSVIAGGIALVAVVAGVWADLVITVAALKACQDSAGRLTGNALGAAEFFPAYLGAVFLTSALLTAIAACGISAAYVTARTLLASNRLLAVSIISLVGTAAIAACVYFSIRLSLAPVVCAAEGLGPLAALRRSHTLVEDYVTPVVGVYFLLGLAAFILMAPLFFFAPIPTGDRGVNNLVQVYQYLFSCCFAPLGKCAAVLLYSRLKSIQAE